MLIESCSSLKSKLNAETERNESLQSKKATENEIIQVLKAESDKLKKVL